MDGLTESYMLFFLFGFHFLLPLACIGRISAADEADPDLPEAVLTGLPTGRDDRRIYRVTVEYGEQKAGIWAETISGLVQVSKDQVWELPGEVRSHMNRYISGMTLLDGPEDGKILAYVLEPSGFHTVRCDERGVG